MMRSAVSLALRSSQCGQAAAETLLVMSILTLALFVSWQGAAPLAVQLQRAASGFFRAALTALALA